MIRQEIEMQNPVGIRGKFAGLPDPILSALPKDYQGWQMFRPARTTHR